MANVTLAIDEKTAERMKRDKATNYSELCRTAIRNHFLDQSSPRVKESSLKTLLKIENKIMSKLQFNTAGNSKYGGGPSWLINLGFRAMRLQKHDEAAYCFDGARCANVKYIDRPNVIEDTLNNSLIVLRDFCLALAGEEHPTSMSRCFDLKAKSYLIYTKENDNFLEDPDESRHLWFDNKKFFANTLYFVLAFMFANESPIPSRSEVDPFGANMAMANRNYVLRFVERLLEEPIESKDSGNLDFDYRMLFEFVKEESNEKKEGRQER